jgi:hypothetical protein
MFVVVVYSPSPAFDMGEKHLGIPRLLDVEDIMSSKPEVVFVTAFLTVQQFSVMTYLGQFFKKYGGSTRPLLKRTNTVSSLPSEDKKKEQEKKQHRNLARTVSLSTAEKKTGPTALRVRVHLLTCSPSQANRNSGLLVKCHISGEIIKGVKPVEWNGNTYHPVRHCPTSLTLIRITSYVPRVNLNLPRTSLT